MTTFREETGSMHPIVCCKEHNTSRHDLHDLCATNDIGEVCNLLDTIKPKCHAEL